jgi:hypothetical protein
MHTYEYIKYIKLFKMYQYIKFHVPVLFNTSRILISGQVTTVAKDT